ncbi:4-hydroxy-tetrahydrodipicolinate synthase [Rothia nasimurium]|uniref:4-hydroxy-tetrahydrodipicolinate synthase n=1 Tax=Rothia nasimurium TaxID=85336 RepID=A0A4Y9F6E8_9MICC|nr:4-hydroxy-tetrahydrodipicolinate synthase [Rothia nasimurium]MBF0807526.1 4-hydroxy-tetrahydrodipicolinate synthase [Rothia nasimurium]TFU23628.1 4-hydroxy-tetrahydrodipicolinate synthase [Rothia nasimurium]
MSETAQNTSTAAEPVFGRLLTAMVTPFAANGEVDEQATAALATNLVDRGHDGLIVCGTTGEYSTMTDEENENVFRIVKETVGGRAKIVAGVGSNDTAHTLHLASRAEAVGVDGLLVVTPYYNKPTQTGLEAHFRTVADAVKTPVMIYDIPGRAGIPITPAVYRALADHENIVAVKDAKADFTAATEVMETTDLDYYSGDDGLTLPWLAMGAVGLVGVTSHVAPEHFRQLIDATVAGDLATAQKLHLDLAPVVRAAMSRVPGCVAAKQILTWQGILDSATVRLPHVLATDEEAALMRSDLEGSIIASTLVK